MPRFFILLPLYRQSGIMLYMLKDYIKQKNISIYRLAKDCDIPYSSLNDIVNGKVDIMNSKLEFAFKLSRALDISIDELCKIAVVDIKSHSDEFDTEINVKVKNKSFYAEYEDDGALIDIKLCKVNEDTSYFIEDISRWSVEEQLQKKKLEDK